MSAYSSTGDGHDQVATTHARLFWALGGTLAFSIVEALAGWRSGSLALLADAGHMVTDGAVLGLADLQRLVGERGIDHCTFQPEAVALEHPIRIVRDRGVPQR